MDSLSDTKKPHAVCVPFPAQGHINPMLKLAKLLHHRGFHVTFVNTEYNSRRLLKSRGPHALDGLLDFRFETIPDGLPGSDTHDQTQDVPSLCYSTSRNCLEPFRELLKKLDHSSSDDGVPPVTCIVADGIMSFTLDAAEEIGVPEVLFWTTSACGFLAYVHYPHLVERGFVPLKDDSFLRNGYLDTTLDWIPGMSDIRLKDLPSFVRTTDKNDIMFNFFVEEATRAKRASAIVLNTFDDLENEVLKTLASMLPPVYTIGPLQLLLDKIPKHQKLESIGSNLWREEPECLQWLDSKEPRSVVYVNFGSITVMTPESMVEFAWGLANSKKMFFWVIRPDLVRGKSAMLPPEFLEEMKDRGFMAGWAPQEQVLKHPAVGGFLTHSGWNSTIESICAGVPLVCWPFFAEQQTNCRFSCREWGIGMEIDKDVKRDDVERLVTELMDGEKGKEIRNKAKERKRKAEEATAALPTGSSYLNFEKVVKEVLVEY